MLPIKLILIFDKSLILLLPISNYPRFEISSLSRVLSGYSSVIHKLGLEFLPALGNNSNHDDDSWINWEKKKRFSKDSILDGFFTDRIVKVQSIHVLYWPTQWIIGVLNELLACPINVWLAQIFFYLDRDTKFGVRFSVLQSRVDTAVKSSLNFWPESITAW